MREGDESGYLFRDGKITDFEIIMKEEIDFSWKTGALRIRTTATEINVDFIAELKPTKEQLDTIKKLKLPSRKLFFEIIDKDNKVLKGCRGFDRTTEEMEQQIENFYKESGTNL